MPISGPFLWLVVTGAIGHVLLLTWACTTCWGCCASLKSTPASRRTSQARDSSWQGAGLGAAQNNAKLQSPILAGNPKRHRSGESDQAKREFQGGAGEFTAEHLGNFPPLPPQVEPEELDLGFSSTFGPPSGATKGSIGWLGTDYLKEKAT